MLHIQTCKMHCNTRNICSKQWYLWKDMHAEFMSSSAYVQQCSRILIIDWKGHSVYRRNIKPFTVHFLCVWICCSNVLKVLFWLWFLHSWELFEKVQLHYILCLIKERLHLQKLLKNISELFLGHLHLNIRGPRPSSSFLIEINLYNMHEGMQRPNLKAG